MAIYNSLFNQLTGQSSDGTWAYGSCGTSPTIPSWMSINASTGVVTIDDNNAVAGDYDFNYSFPADGDCEASCTTVVLTINVTDCDSAGTYTGTPGVVNITI